MKPRKAFYMDNIETIKELEDKLCDLTTKMENNVENNFSMKS